MTDAFNPYDRIAQVSGELDGSYTVWSNQMQAAERAEAIRMLLHPHARGDALKYARKAMGFTRSKLADVIGSREGYVKAVEESDWELQPTMRWILLGMLIDGVVMPE